MLEFIEKNDFDTLDFELDEELIDFGKERYQLISKTSQKAFIIQIIKHTQLKF